MSLFQVRDTVTGEVFPTAYPSRAEARAARDALEGEIADSYKRRYVVTTGPGHRHYEGSPSWRQAKN